MQGPADLILVKGAYDRAGGPETVLQTILSRLDRTRYRPLLALVARPGEILAPILQDLAAQVPSCRIDWRGIPAAPLVAREIGRLFRDRPGALLHSNDMRSDLLAYMLTRMRPTPWIAHVHGWLGETHKGRYKLYEAIDRRLVRGADLALVGSRAMQREVAAGGARRVEVVTNGVEASEPTAFDEEAARIRSELAADGRLVVGMVGRLHPGKGQAFLIEALAQLRRKGRDLVGLIPGEGPAEDEYRRLAGELGVAEHIRFPGLVSDVRPYLRAMDIVCVPSLKDSLPLTTLEAMSVVRPVIASTVGDLPYAIEDGRNGLLVEPGSADALAGAIERLLADPALRARLAHAGRETLVARFTQDAMLASFQGYCDEVLAGRPARAA